MITDRLSDAVWLSHPGGTANIGGVPYQTFTMTPLPGGDLFIQVARSADPTGKGYPCAMFYTTRPIYSRTGCTLKFTLRFGTTAPAAMNAMEVDGMYAMTCADGKTRLFNGSAQWVPGIGWQIVNAAGDWISTGYNPVYEVGKEYEVEFVHGWDLTANRFSFVRIDKFKVIAPAPQNVPASMPVPAWAPGFVNVQIQPSGQPAGLAWAVTIGGKIKLRWM